jgi:hypothetical protein
MIARPSECTVEASWGVLGPPVVAQHRSGVSGEFELGPEINGHEFVYQVRCYESNAQIFR